MHSTEAIEANRAVLRGLFDQVYNKGNVDLVDQFFAESVINHLPANPTQDPIWGAKQQRDYLTKGRRDRV